MAIPPFNFWAFRLGGAVFVALGVAIAMYMPTQHTLVCDATECIRTRSAMASTEIHAFPASALGRPTLEDFRTNNQTTRTRVLLEIEGRSYHFGIDPRIAAQVDRYLDAETPQLKVHDSSLLVVITLSSIGGLIGLPMLLLGWSPRVRRWFLS